MDWQYTNDRTVQLRWCFPHSSRCRYLAVLPALVQTTPSGGATRSGSDAVTCVLPVLFWRCNPHAPGGATRTRLPFPRSSGSASRTCPRRCLACVQCCLAGKRFSPVSALLPAGTLTVSHTRRDVASPASISRPCWWARSGTAALVQSGRAHVFIAIPASDGGLKLFVELPPAALLLLPSLLAGFQHCQRHSTLMLLRCYPPTSLV